MNVPRLKEGLEVVPLPDGIAVVNGGAPVLFQGRAAGEVLVPLLATLDGILNAEGLASSLEMPLPHVEKGLALLDERGLIEEAT